IGLLQVADELKAQQAALREAARRAEYARHIDVLDGEKTS
ncbi:MAG: hypothetical protein JWP31_256, partial [Aeromicrobium sp.]|nr:hypothetical protein [Aeromicrobium sp.]